MKKFLLFACATLLAIPLFAQKRAELSIVKTFPMSGDSIPNLKFGDTLYYGMEVKNEGPDPIVAGEDTFRIIMSPEILGLPFPTLSGSFYEYDIPVGATVFIGDAFVHGKTVIGGSTVGVPENITLESQYVWFYVVGKEGLIRDRGIKRGVNSSGEPVIQVDPEGDNFAYINNVTFYASDSGTSLVDIYKDNISIYPNPANSNLTILNNSVLDWDSYSVYDYQGKLVAQGNAIFSKGSLITISLHDLVSGYYYLQLYSSITASSHIHPLIIKK